MKKYNIFKNSKYALEGLLVLLKEKAFVIELSFFIILNLILYFLNLDIIYKIVMFMSLIIVLIVEALNTAIEYVVDLVTNQWHELAKKAKDTASAAVFLSIIQVLLVWGIILFTT